MLGGLLSPQPQLSGCPHSEGVWELLTAPWGRLLGAGQHPGVLLGLGCRSSRCSTSPPAGATHGVARHRGPASFGGCTSGGWVPVPALTDCPVILFQVGAAGAAERQGVLRRPQQQDHHVGTTAPAGVRGCGQEVPHGARARESVRGRGHGREVSVLKGNGLRGRSVHRPESTPCVLWRPFLQEW